MKSFFGCLLFVLLAPRSEAADCACATYGLHVRSGHSLNSPIIGTMTNGQCVTFKGDRQVADGYTWAHVDYNGKDGYAAVNWLNIHPCGAHDNVLQLSGCPRIITRAEWGARAPKYVIGKMGITPKYVFVHHGATAPCYNEAACKAEVLSYQKYHMDTHGWPDIGYSFVVGEDGHAYEARGWDTIGAHTYGYNSVGLGICVIGNFMERLPNQAALNTLKQLINCGVSNGKISSTYILRGHRDMPDNQTACPGQKLWELIKTWPHY
ncbi:peptidoglycan-recognition protein SC1a-like [Haliotis cracherodii]|uniref:peptidoglycan-recognition protein SC1a-like n=1 Tax=Haliotis cracherodii TaxID=6455 RepID=UPI0039ECFD59